MEVNQAMQDADVGLKTVEENFNKAEDTLGNDLSNIERHEKRSKEESSDEIEQLKQYPSAALTFVVLASGDFDNGPT